MAVRTCWACSSRSHMTLKGGLQFGRDVDEGSEAEVAGILTCDECEAVNFARAWLIQGELSHFNMTADVWFQSFAKLDWFPLTGDRPAFPDVPEHISQVASEAYATRSIDAFRASIILARAVIEATAKEKGITKSGIFAKIEQMQRQGLIRQHIADGANEVRHLGNDLAHGDFGESTSQEDTDLVLALMSEVLLEVFQSPARVEHARATRLARSANKTQSDPEPPAASN